MPLINRLYFNFRHYLSTRWPRTFCYLDRRKSIVKFIIAGCFSGGTDLFVLFILHGLLKLEIVLSTSGAFIISFLVSFTLQKFWTFRNHNQSLLARQLTLYISAALISLYLNGLAMHTLVNRLAVWYLLAQFVVNLVLGLCNFLVYKFIIFRKQDETNGS